MKTRIQLTNLVALATTAICLLPIASHGQQADVAKAPSPPGTYSSAQSWDSPKMPMMAPLPFNPFPELPVFSIGEGRFIYDDREVDYVTLRQEAAKIAAAENSPAGEMLAAQAGASGPTLHIGNMGNGQLAFAIRMAEADSVWDLYFANNIVAERWRWRRVYSGVKCDANGEAAFSMQQPDPSQGFFVVLNAADDDLDGLGNGYEAWFNYNGEPTDWNLRDSDGDNLEDGWEVEYGLNPTSTGGPDDVADGNPDGDLDFDMTDLTNFKEFQRYSIFDGSYDPLKAYGTAANRPVVWVTTSTPTPSCETASFSINRFGGSAADYTQPLLVYYSVGGDLSYGTDYSLSPAPMTSPGDQDDPDGFPRIFLAKIPENVQSVTIVVSFIGHPVTSGAKKLDVALTPYSVARKTQVASAAAWGYVVDVHNKMDRTTSTLILRICGPSPMANPCRLAGMWPKKSSLPEAIPATVPCPSRS